MRCFMTKIENHLKDCDSLEEKYKETGLFEILKILGLDEKHSDSHLVDAVNYYKKKDGVIENDAPINFLSARDKKMVIKNGEIRF